MKTLMWIAGLIASSAMCFGGAFETYILERTNRMYPSVTDNASPLGKACNADITWYESHDPSVFKDPLNYEKMVARNAEKLGIKPVALDIVKEDAYRRDAEFRDAYEKKMAGTGDGRPRQYNGRPLPRNWIDPAQADRNFFDAQRNAELERLNQQLQQLQNQPRR